LTGGFADRKESEEKSSELMTSFVLTVEQTSHLWLDKQWMTLAAERDSAGNFFAIDQQALCRARL
jgi:hypothetical protein